MAKMPCKCVLGLQKGIYGVLNWYLEFHTLLKDFLQIYINPKETFA